jgi:beta-glucosidase
MPYHSFPKNFVWGTATSSYQIEGAADRDGRGASIWDTFSNTQGRTFNGESGRVACDHYHRYAADVALLRDLGIQSYRFSIAWPRILPAGTGALNAAGLDFYDRLVDELLAQGIEPTATLYHWDLPQALEDKGGWRNRATVAAFEQYCHAVVEKLGDRVGRWFTINEPWCAWWLGHKTGIHAPGATEPEKVFRNVSHHLLLAHGVAMRAIRELAPGARAGIVHNASVAVPLLETEADLALSREQFRRDNSWLMQPVLAGSYPRDEWEALGDDVPDVQPGDLELIATPSDFLGINIYNATSVAHAPLGLRPHEPWHPRTDFDWPVTPECLYWAIRHAFDLWDIPEVFVTENGCAYPDVRRDGEDVVEDYARVQYLRDHLKALHRAVSEGLRVKGYYLWSFLDNFEWAEGYSKRFGMVHVNFETLERTPKLSARWYSRLIQNGGF